jgi:DUF4097 and DUF4098 domain-containing protein YvlB
MASEVRNLSAAGGKRIGKLLIGLLLVGAGVAFFFVPAGSGFTGHLWTVFLTSMMWLWPLFLVCMGIVRVMGFAVERKPRSPLGGTLLISIGVLFLASRFHADLNGLRIYGRYWLVLLAIFAAVELLRYYSHRHAEGPPPRMFTAGRLIVIGLIVGTGVLANRVAGSNPSLLSSLKLPGVLGGIRDSVVGETFTFTDAPITAQELRPGARITVSNSFGDLKVTAGQILRASLTKGVRAWNEQDARQISDKIRLVVNQTPDGITISTNREQLNQQFTTDIQLEVPASALLSISGSYGTINASGTRGQMAIKSSYGKAIVSNVAGDLSFELAYSDITASSINGNLIATGAKNARISGISGSVELSASNGSVDLRNVSGEVQVEAPFSRIVAADLGETAQLRTQHASVQITRAADLIIVAPHSDVRAENINGDLQVSSSNSDIQLRAISGGVTISAERSSVNAEDVRGPVEVETSHGSVVVKNFYEGVDVRTSYRDVTLVAAGHPVDDIKVDNDHGEIRLVLPESSEFVLDASSESGQVRQVGFGTIAQKGRDALRAVLGSDGPTITLRTSFKNITIQATEARQAVATGGVN